MEETDFERKVVDTRKRTRSHGSLYHMTFKVVVVVVEQFFEVAIEFSASLWNKEMRKKKENSYGNNIIIKHLRFLFYH